MRLRELFEDGRIVKGVNTTPDVGPDEIKTQAAKFGNTVDRDGRPPTLSKKVKGKSTNVAFNLGLTETIRKQGNKYVIYSKDGDKKLGTYNSRKAAEQRLRQIEYFKHKESIEEGYKLQLERDPNMYVLHIMDTKTGKRTEVRGKSDYETNNDPNDKLHQLLDKLGKSANFAELINGEVVTINPKHPDAEKAKSATDKAFSEKWSKKYKDSINCSNPKGFSQKAHCAGRKKK